MEVDTEESTENGDHDDEGVSYKKLLDECDKQLYAGCKYSNLSFTLHLYHIKCFGGISNKTFRMILELLRDAFPHITALPSSSNEAKKFTKALGLGLDGKTKDNKNTRKDLEEMGIRHDLHLRNRPNGKPYLPPASYTMSTVENHDGHILMQDVLPIALLVSVISRTQSRVVKAVTDYCFFYKWLCVKVLDPSELDKMEYQLARTLCELEQIFPPSFFTVMVHLTIHLIYEAKLGGPVHYRWMYLVEQYLMQLKSYVRNKAQPEGSIIEGYIKEECLNFYSRCFEGVETPFNRPPRNDENVKVVNKRPPNDFESFHLCYKTKDGTYLQEATREMMVIANQEISSKVKELVGPEGIAEDAVVAKIARDVLNKLFGNEEPHCYGVGVTKSQISKFCCDLRRMRGEVLADENRFLKEKVDNQTKEIHTQKKQLEMCNKELETCKKQLATQNKKVESYRKQVETQSLQMKNMEQKLDGVYAMLKLLPAFPDLDNVASTSAAGTCDKQPSSILSPFMDEEHYTSHDEPIIWLLERYRKYEYVDGQLNLWCHYCEKEGYNSSWSQAHTIQLVLKFSLFQYSLKRMRTSVDNEVLEHMMKY
ncbi:ribose 5-phosphate isomerase A [Tanacetum coccineum]